MMCKIKMRRIITKINSEMIGFIIMAYKIVIIPELGSGHS